MSDQSQSTIPSPLTPHPPRQRSKHACVEDIDALHQKVCDSLAIIEGDFANKLQVQTILNGISNMVALCKEALEGVRMQAEPNRPTEMRIEDLLALTDDVPTKSTKISPKKGAASFGSVAPKRIQNQTSREKNTTTASPRTTHGLAKGQHHLPPLTMTTGAVLSPSETASYGQCIAAACYFILESLLVRTYSDRLSLFVKNEAGLLCLAANVGAGTLAVTKEVPIGPNSLVQHVCSTQIAANLSRTDIDDVADCKGPTTARNTIAFPVRAHPHAPILGVLQLVNKKKGSEPYDQDDELLLHAISPSVACILERYPTRLQHFPFDPRPLHVWSPLPSYSPPEINVVRSLSAVPTQLVFHRGDEGRYARKAWAQNTRDVNTTSAATHLQDIEHHLRIMEGCWKGSIVENMHLERLVLQKEHHIHDARDIIARKQKKLEHMKNVLCDEVGRHLRGESALTKSIGGI